MDVVQLQKPDGTAVEVFLCQACGFSYLERGVAERCCVPPVCEFCGEAVERPGRVSHDACWHANRVDKAEKLDEWGGWVYLEGRGHNYGYFDSVESLMEFCDEESVSRPELVFVCEQIPFPSVGIDLVVDHVADNSFEDAEDQLSGLDELGAALAVFNKANEALVSYEPDYKRVVRVPAAPAEAAGTQNVLSEGV